MNGSRSAMRGVHPEASAGEGRSRSPWWHLLGQANACLETYSLDVAAGIVGAAIFLQSLAEVGALPWKAFFCLGCAAVAVYNIDHLIDAREGLVAASPRRARHSVRRRSMAWLAGLATVAGAVVAVSLPGRILTGGLFLVGNMAAYFAGVVLGVGGVAKRLGAAIGWTAAAALPAFANAAQPPDLRMLAATVILAGTAWLNLQSYAIADGPGEGRPHDRPGRRLRLATVSGVAVLVSAALSLDPGHFVPWFALAAAGFLQALLPALPGGLVHPVGEWGFALLALVRLGP